MRSFPPKKTEGNEHGGLSWRSIPFSNLLYNKLKLFDNFLSTSSKKCYSRVYQLKNKKAL